MELTQETRTDCGLTWKYLPLKLKRKTMEESFKTHILPRLRPTWKNVQTKLFTEGITNVLIGFYEASSSREESRDRSDMILLRMNGEGTDSFLDRRAEICIMMSLNRARVLPPLYFEVTNGICYGYIHGRPFTVDDMQDDEMMKRTAKAMARLHAVPIPDAIATLEPFIWSKMRLFLTATTGTYADLHKTRRFEEIFGSLATVSREVGVLQLELSRPALSLVFCHNDLLCGNLIYDKESDKVSMVDFEYGGANPAAYDIGNHFCEFAGINEPVDYDKYPSDAIQFLWLRHYLQETYRIKGLQISVPDEAILSLYRNVNRYALAAHLFWTTWALVQAGHSNIDFDYIEYAGIRWREYQKQKHQFLNINYTAADR